MCCGKMINLPRKILTTRELKEIKPKEVNNGNSNDKSRKK